MATMERTRDGVSSRSNGRPVHLRPSDIRALVPPLGLREYWFPALEAKKVRNKPVGLKLLGEELVFFRGENNEVKALWNVCPHRGGSLMHGDCHYAGTISCPYHGWTYDGEGNVLAVLPEGPDSQVPGKVKARAYPTRTLKGMVFVWMGIGEPVPIEEDVPPEFFDDITQILYRTEYWPVNWNVALENGGDAHVPYVHRNSLKQLIHPMPGSGPIPQLNKVVPGRAVILDRMARQGGRLAGSGAWPQHYFPALGGKWPKHRWRTRWSWVFGPARKRVSRRPAWDCPQQEWKSGHHLPGMFRNDHRTDMYTRNSVPVTESLSRQVYFKATRPNSWVGRVYERVHFTLIGRWMQVTNFSRQDFTAVAPQRYDTAEHLSATDTHQVLWRRLVLQARGMMSQEEAYGVDISPPEQFNFERQMESDMELQKPEELFKAQV